MYQNVSRSHLFCGSRILSPFTVLNVFFVRELTKRLPANSPVIVTAVNPGYCKSQLRRYLPLPLRILNSIVEVLLARTTEEGSRQLLWAAIGGAGREFELRGAYVSKATLQEVSDYVLSDEREGTALQTRLWVRDTSFCLNRIMGHIIENTFQDESVEILSRVEPKFENTVREILSSNCSSRAGVLHMVIAPSG